MPRDPSFWEDCGQLQAPDIEGSEVVVEGYRYLWVRNELGKLYKKCINPHGQIGGHLAPTHTLQEYIQQAREMAERHAASLSPEIKAAIGYEIVMAIATEPMKPAARMEDDPSGAAFL